jgi:membrane fusion protein (multidrug efflux system)
MASAGRTDVPMTSATTSSKVRGAEAGVAEARTALVSAQQELAAARVRVETFQARLREAQANAQRASRDLERLKRLIAKEEISQQQFDAAVADNASRQAAVDSAASQVREGEAGVRVAESRIQREQARLAQADAGLSAAQTAPQQVAMTQAHADSASARAAQARAELERAQLNLSYTRIVAPVAGLVSKKSFEVGQTVQAGQPLLALVALEDIWVVANFKETQLREMRPGQPVTVAVDAYGGREYRGRVDSISAATGARFSLMPPENASGNFVKVVQRVPVKIYLEKGQDSDHLLRPGMSVVPTVITR